MKAIPAMIVIACTVLAQQQPAGFEVASIKANHSGGSYGMRILPGGRFTATNVSPLMLIRRALGVELGQITGAPDWMNADRYDVNAKMATSRDISEEELQPLLQRLLADRFALNFHRETRFVPVYSLVVSREGSKLTMHAGDSVPSLKTEFAPDKATMLAGNTTMSAFSKALSRLPGRPVIDNTELKGGFDFKLEWSPDQTNGSALPSLFTAVQEQLGLKLEAVKGPVEVIVIDHAEPPSSN